MKVVMGACCVNRLKELPLGIRVPFSGQANSASFYLTRRTPPAELDKIARNFWKWPPRSGSMEKRTEPLPPLRRLARTAQEGYDWKLHHASATLPRSPPGGRRCRPRRIAE